MLASPTEIAEWKTWQARRELLVGDSEEAHADDVKSRPFTTCLTVVELGYLRGNRATWPECAYMLSQNPRDVPCHSDTRFMMCQTKSQTLVWSDVGDRAIHPKGLLALQGFPVYDDSRPTGCQSSLDFSREASGLPRRELHRLSEASGNSMPVPLIMIPLIWALGRTTAGQPCEPACLPFRSLGHFLDEPDADESDVPTSKRRRLLRETLSCESCSCKSDKSPPMPWPTAEALPHDPLLLELPPYPSRPAPSGLSEIRSRWDRSCSCGSFLKHF